VSQHEEDVAQDRRAPDDWRSIGEPFMMSPATSSTPVAKGGSLARSSSWNERVPAARVVARPGASRESASRCRDDRDRLWLRRRDTWRVARAPRANRGETRMRPLPWLTRGLRAWASAATGPREVHVAISPAMVESSWNRSLIAEQTDRDHHEGRRDHRPSRTTRSPRARVRRVSGVEKHSVDSAGAAVERFRGRLIEESLVSAGQHDGVGARARRASCQGARDVGTPASTTTHCGCPNAFSTSRSHEVETSSRSLCHNVLGVHSVLDLKECVELGIHVALIFSGLNRASFREINPPARQQGALSSIGRRAVDRVAMRDRWANRAPVSNGHRERERPGLDGPKRFSTGGNWRRPKMRGFDCSAHGVAGTFGHAELVLGRIRGDRTGGSSREPRRGDGKMRRSTRFGELQSR